MEKKRFVEVVAALIRREEEILITQRRKDDAFGLLWEFPGGAVEKGETHKEALKREIKEELDVDIEIVNFVGKFDDENHKLRIEVYLYECFIRRGILSPRECAAFEFVRLDKIKKGILAPVDRKIFDYLIRKNNA